MGMPGRLLSPAVLLTLFVLAAPAPAQELPKGTVVDQVVCQADPSQSYALYLPSTYSPDRAWPVIYLFDPGGRGANAVERYRAAAEEYGYVVAGSNNSRNLQPNANAVTRMPADVAARVHVDPRRVYTGGMSGGARVALGTALEGQVAGVFASSAGYPDATPRARVPFALFATTGTEDFNHLELRRLDQALTTPHRLAVFDGAHGWPPAPVVLDGVEWMELQAMKSGLKPRDEQEIDRIFAKRLAAASLDASGSAAAGAPPAAQQYVALRDLVADFQGLRNTSALATRAAALGRTPAVSVALKREREEDDREAATAAWVLAQEKRLDISNQHGGAMMVLLDKWEELAATARQPDDSPDRRMARRLMAWLSLNSLSMDDEYREMVREIRAAPAKR